MQKKELYIAKSLQELEQFYLVDSSKIKGHAINKYSSHRISQSDSH